VLASSTTIERYDQFVQALHDRGRIPGGTDTQRGDFMCYCPAHSDATPSLHVTRTPDGNVLWHCFAGCDQDEVDAVLDWRAYDDDDDHDPWADEEEEPDDEPQTAEGPRGCTRAQLERHLGFPLPADWTDTHYGDIPAVAIPYPDSDGSIFTTRYRVDVEGDRFRWATGTIAKESLYRADLLPLVHGQGAILVEGESDAAVGNLLGIATLGLTGAGMLGKTPERALQHLAALYVPIENDEAGRKLRVTLEASSLRSKLHIVSLGGAKDLRDFYLLDPATARLRLDAALASATAVPMRGRTARELLDTTPEDVDWIIPGVLVRGWTTKIGAREKTGKGVLAYYLIGKCERGEASVFGPTKQMTMLILTEEPDESAREKAASFGVERARIIFGWELRGSTWEKKCDTLVMDALDQGHGGIFVDNASRAIGVEDEAGTEFGRAVELLQDKCRDAGLACLLDVHHRKGYAYDVFDKSRGGTAVMGAVDVNIEMERVGKENKRRLSARGRIRATNWIRVIELSEDGTNFFEIDDTKDEDVGNLASDVWILNEYGNGVEAIEFAARINTTVRSAQRRLKDIVEAGYAERRDGKHTKDGRTPTTWHRIYIEPEETETEEEATDDVV
jgi:hypothetical protein